jgi:hypothetical protein
VLPDSGSRIPSPSCQTPWTWPVTLLPVPGMNTKSHLSSSLVLVQELLLWCALPMSEYHHQFFPLVDTRALDLGSCFTE